MALRDKMLGNIKNQHKPEELITVSREEINEKVKKAAENITNKKVSPVFIGMHIKLPHELDVLIVNEKLTEQGKGNKISKEDIVLIAIRSYFKK